MSRPPWILATRNAGKLRELRDLFAEAEIAVVDLAKARYYAARAPGRTVVADDSGLEVFALGGEPGVRSRRWSGRSDLEGAALDAANNALLVERMRGREDRRARFVCAAAWCDGRSAEVVRGELSGTIIAARSGSGGFGYDPHFVVTELGRTLAEASAAEKQRVAHRGRAFRALLERVRGDGSG